MNSLESLKQIGLEFMFIDVGSVFDAVQNGI
jgi:hypothetical protein